MTVLCYHTVSDDWDSRLAVGTDDFAAQAAWLAAHRRVLDLPAALAALDRSWRLPRGAVTLTFDDGLRGVYDHAFPVLRRLGLPATVYVVTRTLTDPPRPVDWVREAHPPGGLDWIDADEIREMRAAGIRFGSHTVTHRDLPGLSFAEQLRELRDSRETLEDLLHEPVDTVAYPRGLHDAATREAARRAGYEAAFGLPERQEHVGDQSVPRVGVYRANPLRTVRLKASRGYLPLRLRLGTPEARRALGQVRGAVSRGATSSRRGASNA